MKKIIFWAGIIVLIVGLILFFLAGATGPDNQPWVPSVYQTNQAYWLALSLAGFVLIALGLFMKFKSLKSNAVKSKKKR
ncbi:DUF2919 family protein [Candidatus Pacearchaeota archaeon]|nr:DUF2919 family protein [Candidatus Pacearchaeota archaeon]